MKKIHYAFSICDSEFLVYDITKGKINGKNFKSLKKEEIVNTKLFCNEFYQFVNENHIKVPLFGYNIHILKNKLFSFLMEEKLNDIFHSYFHKIMYISIEDILKWTKESCFLCITENYIDYYYMKKNEKNTIRINLEIFNNNVTQAINHLFSTIFKPKKLTIFGNKKDIMNQVEFIKKSFKIPVTFSEYSNYYLLEEYKKRKYEKVSLF